MQPWEIAVQAAQSKKAEEIRVLHIGQVSSFTEHFVICNGTNPRQTQAIADGVEEALRQEGRKPLGVEGKSHGDWVLLDYGDFIVHVFTPEKRAFYNLERLWRAAPSLPVPEAA